MLPDPVRGAAAQALPSDEALLIRICEFVADAADCSIESVGPDDDIYETLKVDSLGTAAIFIDIAYTFRVPEPSAETEFAALNTPRKLVDYVRQAARDGHQPARECQATQAAVHGDISLPYGSDFRFVDSVLLHQPNRLATSMTWQLDNPLINSHFAGGPHVVPGVLLAEQIAQSALLLARWEGLVSATDHLSLAQLRCDFRAPAMAPITTQADVSFLATGQRHIGFAGALRVGDLEIARIKGIATVGRTMR